MATNEARGEQGEEFGAGRPSEPGCGFSHTSTTTTYNMINCGQVIQISGKNATVILPENRVGVLHGDVRGFQATSSTHPHPSHPPHTPQPSTTPTTAVVNTPTSGELRYAAGPPEPMELLVLTHKLAGALSHNWKLLATPLSIPDHELASIDVEEKTLLLKVNSLLKKWVAASAENDRTKMASLLESLNLKTYVEDSFKKDN